jgi:hypothetical protein
VLAELNPRAFNTLGVEKFFSVMRSLYPNPTVLQWLIARSSAIYEMYKRSLAEHCYLGWDLFNRERFGRGHYGGATTLAASARPLFSIKKPRSSTDDDALEGTRKHELRTLRTAAHLVKPLRMKRVTDHGKDEVGRLPHILSARPRVGPIPQHQQGFLEAMSKSSFPVTATSNNGVTATNSASGSKTRRNTKEEEELLLRAGDVVVVKAVFGSHTRYWLAQLCQSVCRRTCYVMTSKAKQGCQEREWIKVDSNLQPDKVSVLSFTEAEEGSGDDDELDCDDDGMLFRCDKDKSVVNVEAIYGALKKFDCVTYVPSTPSAGGGDIASFRISTDLHEYMENWISEGAVDADRTAFDQHGIMWMGLVRDDDVNNDEDEDDGGEDSDDCANAYGRQRKRRAVQQDTSRTRFEETVAAKAISFGTSSRGRTVRRYDFKAVSAGSSAAEGDDIVCVACNAGGQASKIVLCDFVPCKGAYHIHCLDPPLPTVPSGRWVCPDHNAMKSNH